jgi:hypothetical protein
MIKAVQEHSDGSAPMKAIELIGDIDEQHRLRASVPEELPAGPVPEVVVTYISSVIPSQPLPSDLVLNPASAEFRSTNLKTLSTLRLHELATIHTSSLVRYLGVVDGPTFNLRGWRQLDEHIEKWPAVTWSSPPNGAQSP